MANKHISRGALLLFGALFLCACEGKMGPTGPQGDEGPPGPPGTVNGTGFVASFIWSNDEPLSSNDFKVPIDGFREAYDPMKHFFVFESYASLAFPGDPSGSLNLVELPTLTNNQTGNPVLATGALYFPDDTSDPSVRFLELRGAYVLAHLSIFNRPNPGQANNGGVDSGK